MTLKSNKLVGLFLALIMLISMMVPISIFAITENVVYGGSLTDDIMHNAFETANKNSGQITDSDGTTMEDNLYVKVKGVQTVLVELDTANKCIKIDKDIWNTAKDSDVSKVMQKFVDALNSSGASDDAVQDFMTEFQSADNSISSIMLTMSFSSTKADLYQAYNIMRPFLDILNIVLGVGCVCLIILLMFSTVMDLAYIGLPVWREAQNDKNGSGKKPFGVSYEALRTVNEVESTLGSGDGGYKNSYLLYFKRRALTYIILALCIMYLICGGISGVITFVLKLVGGMV